MGKKVRLTEYERLRTLAALRTHLAWLNARYNMRNVTTPDAVKEEARSYRELIRKLRGG
jgi:hypothetical protein